MKPFASVACLLVALFSGCDSKRLAAERRAKMEAELARISADIAQAEAQIVEVEKEGDPVRMEEERRENQWKASVAGRHPNWTQEQKDRHFYFLDYKWVSANLSDDADTVREMKKFGSWAFYNLEFTDDDYWDIAKARHYRLFEGAELLKKVYEKKKPLEDKRVSLLLRKAEIERLLREPDQP